MFFTMIVVVIVAVLAVFFASYNQTMIEVLFFGFPVQGTIGLFLVLALALGVVLGILIMLPGLIGRSWTLNQHKRRLAQLENQQYSGQQYYEDSPPSGKQV
jgi:uncharacterized integral membrane protein